MPVCTSSQISSAPRCVAELAQAAQVARRAARSRRPRPARAPRSARRRRSSIARCAAARSSNGTRTLSCRSGAYGRAVLLGADHVERAERAAVERAVRRHEHLPAGRAVRELERALDRLGPRVGEERARDRPQAPAPRAVAPGRAAAACRRRWWSASGGRPARRSRRRARDGEWPMQVTPQPAIRSTTRLPNTSRTREPLPLASATGKRFTTGRKCAASRVADRVDVHRAPPRALAGRAFYMIPASEAAVARRDPAPGHPGPGGARRHGGRAAHAPRRCCSTSRSRAICAPPAAATRIRHTIHYKRIFEIVEDVAAQPAAQAGRGARRPDRARRAREVRRRRGGGHRAQADADRGRAPVRGRADRPHARGLEGRRDAPSPRGRRHSVNRTDPSAPRAGDIVVDAPAS